MKTPILSNSDNGDIARTILWQYDRAPNVSGIILMFRDFFKQSTEDYFDKLLESIKLRDLATDGSDDYGLAVWGKILKLPRAIVTVNGVASSISSDLYKRLLIGRLELLESDASTRAYCSYLAYVFNGNVQIVDGLDMGITFVEIEDSTLTDEERALIEQHHDIAFIYPSGVRSSEHSDNLMFGLDGQQNDEDVEVGGLDESGFNWRLTPKGNWQ